MPHTVHEVKVGHYLYSEGYFYKVVSKKEVNGRGHHTVHLEVDNMLTDHRTVLHYGPHRHVLTVEPTTQHYQLTHLLDLSEGRQYLSMLNHDGDVREDVCVTGDEVVSYLNEWSKKEGEPLKVVLLRLEIDKIHSHGSDDGHVLERVVDIEGLDMKHLYDKHHGHHHVHTQPHAHAHGHA